MIICPKCGKENQDHYKFCLGCGAELPRDLAPKQFAPSRGTPPQGVKPVGAVMADPFAARGPTPSAPPRVAPAPSTGTVPAPSLPSGLPPSGPTPVEASSPPCPQCGHVNAPGTRFCMSCGFNLAASMSAPAPAPSVQPPAGGGGGSATLTALRADKTEVGSFSFSGVVVVGRDSGGIFAGDSYLSPRHATLTLRGGKLRVKDESTLNGTFVKLTPEAPVELRPGDIFRIGQEIVRFETLTPQPPSPDGVERLGSPSKGYVGRIALIIGRDVMGNAFPVPESGVHLGRERGDVLFPEDGYVSGLHCRIRSEGGRVTLTDLGSSNGTFLRLTSERDLKSGDEILMGQQLFRISY